MNGHPTMDGLPGENPIYKWRKPPNGLFFWIVEFTSEWLVYFMENSHENYGTSLVGWEIMDFFFGYGKTMGKN